MPNKDPKKRKDYNRAYYKKNREHILAQTKITKAKWRRKHRDNLKSCWVQYMEKLRLETFTHYGGNPLKCACKGCNVTELAFLSLDHINNDGAEERRKLKSKGGYHFYAWLRKHNYPEGYQVLCYNCNIAKEQKGQCPHALLFSTALTSSSNINSTLSV